MIASFYNHGEPLLNPDVFSIVEHTHRNRVGTNISSNFNWPQPVDINDFIRSGLDYVTVSLDGVTQEAYQQYRVRGDIAEVFDNMKRLVSAKKALKSKTPFVEWQFIVFKHNEHEMAKAREMASEIGVDLLRFVSPGVPPEDMHKLSYRKNGCPTIGYIGREIQNWSRNADISLTERASTSIGRCLSIRGAASPRVASRMTISRISVTSITIPFRRFGTTKHIDPARMLFSKTAPSEDRVETICDKCTVFRQDGAHLSGCARLTTFSSKRESGRRITRRSSGRRQRLCRPAIPRPCSRLRPNPFGAVRTPRDEDPKHRAHRGDFENGFDQLYAIRLRSIT